jgi:hypothetical protein
MSAFRSDPDELFVGVEGHGGDAGLLVFLKFESAESESTTYIHYSKVFFPKTLQLNWVNINKN